MPHYIFAATFVLVVVVLILRVAVSAWLASPKCKVDTDEFIRVFQSLTAFDAVTRLAEAWRSKDEPPPRGDA